MNRSRFRESIPAAALTAQNDEEDADDESGDGEDETAETEAVEGEAIEPDKSKTAA
ncbi:MAG: hypothetical protein AB7O50_03825 [Pseudolabrys sp.]